MPADLDLPSYSRAPLSEGALQQHSTTLPAVHSPAAGPPVPQASTSPPNQSHLLSEVVHCQLQLSSSRARLHHQAVREQVSPTAPAPQGHGVHEGRGPIQPPIRPPKPFSLPAHRARRPPERAGGLRPAARPTRASLDHSTGPDRGHRRVQNDGGTHPGSHPSPLQPAPLAGEINRILGLRPGRASLSAGHQLGHAPKWAH
ncbi:hypothetical protein NDU88_004953 [Pleurodeles waltl]|uniref:Uncharacterized protein n=1 Tax=Pleurodeles waltl TaxID=8319 RepID=A0AAV7KZT7_PLEWA|nr:hypothetical protein NDU88_004953 [Pleurodeles waltl]